jgi:hypothetical protein
MLKNWGCLMDNHIKASERDKESQRLKIQWSEINHWKEQAQRNERLERKAYELIDQKDKEIQQLTTMNAQLEAGLKEAYKSGKIVLDAFRVLEKKTVEKDNEIQRLQKYICDQGQNDNFVIWIHVQSLNVLKKG